MQIVMSNNYRLNKIILLSTYKTSVFKTASVELYQIYIIVIRYKENINKVVFKVYPSGRSTTQVFLT